MEILEPLVELFLGIVDGCETWKQFVFAIIFIGILVGIAALICLI